MSDGETYVLVGAAAGAFGVRGEVRIKPFTVDPEAIFRYSPLTDAEGRVVLTIKSWRLVTDGYAAVVAEIGTREEAQALKSLRLYAPRSRLPALAEDEFYHADLVGLRVCGLDGRALGRVEGVEDFGAGPLLAIRPAAGGPAWLLPFTRACAPHVDLAKGEVLVDPPPGFGPEGAGEGEA